MKRSGAGTTRGPPEYARCDAACSLCNVTTMFDCDAGFLAFFEGK